MGKNAHRVSCQPGHSIVYCNQSKLVLHTPNVIERCLFWPIQKASPGSVFGGTYGSPDFNLSTPASAPFVPEGIRREAGISDQKVRPPPSFALLSRIAPGRVRHSHAHAARIDANHFISWHGKFRSDCYRRTVISLLFIRLSRKL